MLEDIAFNRRRFLGTAAVTIVATQLGMIGCAREQFTTKRSCHVS